ncbi:hypothetical protein C1645_836636 [Glomus cerebriforme]|uniref:Uncharacterized protein n=1 Tax=Glomus cerebriforme TaxID=658196 RepID=A0A397SBJ2_9GLOM|nr:hypothetical protein C1645_836636 [Glomus cerebriforme]
MINAGVFLIRNTDWAKDFIRRGLQTRYDFSSGRNSLKQQTIRDAIKHPDWKKNVFVLDEDDHTIQTSPNRYIMHP